MNRKSKQKLLLRLKVLTICGAAVFMVDGASEICVSAKKVPAYRFETYEKMAVYKSEIPEIKTEIKEIEKFKTNPELNMDKTEEYLLAKIAMAEAEGEDIKGKALVIRTVLNRVQNSQFPDRIVKVIFEKEQFSPISDGRFFKVEPNEECYQALKMVQEQWDESQGALFFESKSKSEWHSKNLQFLFPHGEHYFYK